MNSKADVKTILSLFLFSLSLIVSCHPVPKRVQLPDHVELKKNDPSKSALDSYKGLWFTTTNYATGGMLGRLDLNSGKIDRNILTVGSDTLVLSDHPNGLFLVHRTSADSITTLKGERAEFGAHFVLDKGANPQGVLRDDKGQIWVTNQNKNEVLVLSEDLKQKVGEVDLKSLALMTEPDELAYLAQLYRNEIGKILVTAQRMHRTVRAWKPDALSGLAVIDPQTFKVESTALLPIPNPIAIGKAQGKTAVVGAGDLSTKEGLGSVWAQLDSNNLSLVKNEPMGGKILAADLSQGEEAPTVLVWYPSENKSCVQIGKIKIVCDGNALNEGYVFNAIQRIGRQIFVAYYGAGEAQLWIVNLPIAGPVSEGGQFDVQKIPMDLPIVSFAGGM